MVTNRILETFVLDLRLIPSPSFSSPPVHCMECPTAKRVEGEKGYGSMSTTAIIYEAIKDGRFPEAVHLLTSELGVSGCGRVA